MTMQTFLYLGPIILLTLLLMDPLSSSAQSQHRQVGDMSVSWTYEDEAILFTVTSPDQGWVVLGFNDENNIVGATLHMGGYDEKTKEQYFSERLTLSAGVHKAKTDIKLPTRVVDVEVLGSTDGTVMRFRLPFLPAVSGEYDLRPGNELWLILAYSVSDDLDHHSRFRKHIKVML